VEPPSLPDPVGTGGPNRKTTMNDVGEPCAVTARLVCAVRRFVISLVERSEFGGCFWVTWFTSRRKAGGDKSMPGKQCTVGGVLPIVALRDPSDMVKA